MMLFRESQRITEIFYFNSEIRQRKLNILTLNYIFLPSLFWIEIVVGIKIRGDF
jgi:hypothetical protein